jgi:hypothetical protein
MVVFADLMLEEKNTPEYDDVLKRAVLRIGSWTVLKQLVLTEHTRDFYSAFLSFTGNQALDIGSKDQLHSQWIKSHGKVSRFKFISVFIACLHCDCE